MHLSINDALEFGISFIKVGPVTALIYLSSAYTIMKVKLSDIERQQQVFLENLLEII